MKAAKHNDIKPNNRKKVVGIFFSFKHDDDSILTEMKEKDRIAPIFQYFIFSHSVLRIIKVNFKWLSALISFYKNQSLDQQDL